MDLFDDFETSEKFGEKKLDKFFSLKNFGILQIFMKKNVCAITYL